ncbi:MAG: methyltransferase [Actinomycetales bacterium]|nr:methyltransferase [Actinomycetales bacterium]
MADSGMASSGNWTHWEDLARFHGTGADAIYDFDAVVAGRRPLRGPELDVVALAAPDGLGGRRLAHVQSHVGMETIALARMGADVTAFDFSPTALTRLDDLARRCELAVRTVEADSQRIREEEFAEFHGRFDVVYASVGVLGWIADLDAWMDGAAALLRDGGRLALVELHPLLCMPDTRSPLVIDFPYVNDGRRTYSGTGSYANPEADIPWTVDQYAWSIGEVVTAAIRAGLDIVSLVEHVDAPFDPRGDFLTQEEDGLFRWRIGSGVDGREPDPLPVLFSLVAEKVR